MFSRDFSTQHLPQVGPQDLNLGLIFFRHGAVKNHQAVDLVRLIWLVDSSEDGLPGRTDTVVNNHGRL